MDLTPTNLSIPLAIKKAKKLLLAALSIWIILELRSSLFEPVEGPEGSYIPVALALMLAFSFFWGWTILLIEKSKNWARILNSVLFGLFGSMAIIGIKDNSNWYMVTASLCFVGCVIAAIANLFKRESNIWFRSKRIGKTSD